jgi:hypothetical protein
MTVYYYIKIYFDTYKIGTLNEIYYSLLTFGFHITTQDFLFLCITLKYLAIIIHVPSFIWFLIIT